MKIVEADNVFFLVVKYLVILVIAISFLGWPILIWWGYRRLKVIPDEDINHTVLKYILGAAVIIFAGSLIYVGWFWVSRVESGENEASARFLPIPEARAISYYLKYDFAAYEFDLPEALAKKYRPTLMEIEEPVTVKRYNFRDGKVPAEEKTVTVTDGFYEIDSENTIVYDRVKQRMYFLHELKQ